MSAEGEVALDGRTLGDEAGKAAEGLERQFVGGALPVVARVGNGGTVGRVAVTARESTLKQVLVVLLGVVSTIARVVAHEAALAVLTPEADVDILADVEVLPAAVHTYEPYASVQTFHGAQGLLCCINRHSHCARAGEVAAGIVEHEVEGAALGIAEEGVGVCGRQRTIGRIDTSVEVGEALFCSLLVEGLVEGSDVGIAEAVVLPVVVDTIATEEHEAVNHWLYVLEGAVRFLLRDKGGVCLVAATCGPTLKELDTREDVRTVAVGSIDPAARSLKDGVVPRTEEVGVLPHGEYVGGELSARITSGTARTYVHRNVHPKVAVLRGGGNETVLARHDVGATYVGTHEGKVGLLNTSSLKFSLGGILAALLQGVVEQIEQTAVGKAREVVHCVLRHGRSTCGGQHQHGQTS